MSQILVLILQGPLKNPSKIFNFLNLCWKIFKNPAWYSSQEKPGKQHTKSLFHEILLFCYLEGSDHTRRRKHLSNRSGTISLQTPQDTRCTGTFLVLIAKFSYFSIAEYLFPLGLVYTTPDRFKNAALFPRLGLSSTPKSSRKRSFSKTLFRPEEFENADF